MRAAWERFVSGEWLFAKSDDWERWLKYGMAVREFILRRLIMQDYRT
jgi:hypothetical protein